MRRGVSTSEMRGACFSRFLSTATIALTNVWESVRNYVGTYLS